MKSELFMPHHGRAAAMAVWYPGTGGTPTLYAGGPAFRGVAALMGAAVSPGTHPVVLFSHGMGGTDRAQAWLGADLARRGAIVVMVNHPNSTWGDFDMSQGVRHWTRARDMSAALDALSAATDFEDHIDPSRIMAAGFSFGGWTALSLGGMTGNLDGLVEACGTHRDTMDTCDMLLSDPVGVQKQDRDAWNARYADPRITHVVAMEPGFVWGLDRTNVSGLLPGAVLIGLGDGQTRMSMTDFDKSGLADLLPDARLLRLAPAHHFTAMPLCTSAGPQLLEAEGDAPVCSDPPGTDRAAIHARIVAVIAETLGL